MPPETSSAQVIDAASAFWSIPVDRLLATLGTGANGLSSEAAKVRLKDVGANTIGQGRGASALAAFARQFPLPSDTER